MSNTNTQEKHFDQIPPKDLKAAALQWFSLGYLPLPIIKGDKKPSVLVKEWLSNLSQQSIELHWSQYPDDDIGLHCSKGLVALDSDSPESLEPMMALEEKYGIKSLITVNTKKGTHHYFKLADGVNLKQAGNSTILNPERIDIRCGNSYIIAPPSTDKVLVSESICPLENLKVITQEFADDLIRHNGGIPSCERPSRLPTMDGNTKCESLAIATPEQINHKIPYLRAMINEFKPDDEYGDWTSIMMILHHETQGSSLGLELANEWSSQGCLYKGFKEVAYKWSTFNKSDSKPLTEATLCMMLADRGIDALELKAQVYEDLEPFEICATEVIKAVSDNSKRSSFVSSLKQYSLLGKLDEIRKFAVDPKPLLGSVSLKGQFTVLYANSNAGKTLLTLHMLREAIIGGRIDAENVIYANVDDSASGLLVKGEIAEELGFQQLAIGYQGLTPENFKQAIEDMTTSGEAKGTLIILDTLKKFTDVMSKGESSAFGQLIRKFTTKGGSVVALAHTNKNRNSSGQLVQTGTADIPQDADCTYTLDTEIKGSEIVVTFKNTKARGPVQRIAQYAYSRLESDYTKLLDSVRELSVDEASFDFEVAASENPDDRMILAFKEVIGNAFVGKTELISAARGLTKFSKIKLEKIFTRYSGSDPAKHIWDFTVGEKGLHKYFLHPHSTALDSHPVAEVDLVEGDQGYIMDNLTDE